MGIDAAQSDRRGPRPDWKLPAILDIRIARVPFKAREYRHFKSVYAEYDEAVEFLVRTDGPFPIRALSPVLYVGDEAIVEGEPVEKGTYRFLAFELDRLEPGAPITLGWPGQPPEVRKETDFRYELGKPSSKK